MVQWVILLPAKPDNLSLVPGTHMVEGNDQFPEIHSLSLSCLFLSLTHTHTHTHTTLYMYKDLSFSSGISIELTPAFLAPVHGRSGVASLFATR